MRKSKPINWKKNTALFLGGQAATLIGSSLVGYAVMWYVTLETKSGVMMTLFTVATMAPTFLISPFGGVWADRYSRKNLINISDGIIAVVSLFIALCFSFGIAGIMLLLACSVARSLGQGVQVPAVNALIPQLVPEKHLVRVNSLNSMIQSISTIGSPALSGVLMSFAPIQIILFIDVITAAIGISILYFFVRVPQEEASEAEASGPAVASDSAAESNAGAASGLSADSEAKKKEGTGCSYLHEILSSLSYIRTNSFVLRLIIYSGIAAILITPCALLTPLQVARDFGPDVWRLTAIEIAFSAGMIVGGGVLSVWGGFQNKVKTAVLGIAMFGGGTAALGLLTNFPIYIAVMGTVMPRIPITAM
jgi:DHA3 family macrolide efflux protein-like MFS transporter